MTVSIVTYHTDLDEMRKCLASLHSDVVSTIWVIDNSRDSRMEQLCQNYPKVVYSANTNVGFGAAHNLALRQTPDTYHLVLNSDVRFSPAILPRLVDYMDCHQDVGILQPRVTYADGTKQATARLLPVPIDVFGRRFLPSKWMRKRNARYTLEGISDSHDMDVPYLQGSFLLIRTSDLKKIGLFDERFFMYPEDIDLCRRMWAVARVVRHPAVTIVHDHRAGSYHNWRLLRIHCVNMIKYFCKWGWIFDKERQRINSRCVCGFSFCRM